MDASEVPVGQLYGELAHIWPVMSPAAEYAEEAAHWRTVLREKLGGGGHPVLELGAGGGHNLSHLASEFDATAVDLSNDMLALCRKLNPGVPVHQGDMRTLRLGRTFAAVLIHDAIGHMLDEADLLAAFETAAAHLEPGGILITSPDRFLESFDPPETDQATHTVGGTEVTYFEYTHDPDPSDTTVETIITYFIRTREGLRIEHDRLFTGIFPKSTWLRLLERTGFSAAVRSFYLEACNQPYELLVGTLK